MLDGLELANGPTELHANLGVVRGRVQAPARCARALCCAEHNGQVRDDLVVNTHQHVMVVDLGGGHRQGPQWTSGIKRLDGLTRHRGGQAFEDAPASVVKWGHDQLCRWGIEYGPKRAGRVCDTPIGSYFQRASTEGQCGRGRTVDQSRQPSRSLRRTAPSTEKGGQQDCRQDWAGHHGVPELFEHHGQFDQPEPLTAVVFGDVESQPSLIGQGFPDCRQFRGFGLEGRSGHRGGTVRIKPPTYRASKLFVVATHCNGHLVRSLFDVRTVAPERDRAHRASFDGNLESVKWSGHGVKDHGVAIVTQVEGFRSPKEAVARAHTGVPIDANLKARFGCRFGHCDLITPAAAFMTRPESLHWWGHPRPRSQGRSRAPCTCAVDVPRICRTPSLMRLKPWT